MAAQTGHDGQSPRVVARSALTRCRIFSAGGLLTARRSLSLGGEGWCSDNARHTRCLRSHKDRWISALDYALDLSHGPLRCASRENLPLLLLGVPADRAVARNDRRPGLRAPRRDESVARSGDVVIKAAWQQVANAAALGLGLQDEDCHRGSRWSSRATATDAPWLSSGADAVAAMPWRMDSYGPSPWTSPPLGRDANLRGSPCPSVCPADTGGRPIARAMLHILHSETPRAMRESLAGAVRSCIGAAGRVALLLIVIAGTILFMAALYVLVTGGTAG